MKRTIARGLVATLLLAGGCSSSSNSTGGAGQGGSNTGGSSGTGGSAAGTSGGGTGGGGTGGGGTGGAVAGTGGYSGGGGTAGGAGTGGSGGVGGTGGGATAWLTLPANMPPSLAVPSGATLKLRTHAVGAQIYTCTASGGGDAGATTYAWVLKAPDAKLYDEGNTQVGTHGMGPNWTSSDGSVVIGARAVQAAAPVAGAIPWLLLRATSTTGTGVFSDVSYVQRVSTSGGVAPAAGCDSTTSGTETSVNYMAEYFFYTGGAGAAWLPPPSGLPAAIAVPSGATVKLHDHAIGVQIYTCTASGGGGAGGAGGAGGGGGATTYSWVLKAPDAVLYDATFTQVGTHGMGPNWTSSDGSVVNGARIDQAASPATDAIPWLLLGATSTTGSGAFSDITYIQRLNTVGGKAPATGCSAATVSTEVRIDYSADYYFFTGGSTDGGTNG